MRPTAARTDVVETLQHPWELDQLRRLYDSVPRRRVLEVGAWYGGTLRVWFDGRPERVVVIDDEMRNAAAWATWARGAGSALELLRGDSRDPAIRERAWAAGPYDWVFVDADHSYTAGRADWEAYSPLVVSGGVYALHDIRGYEHGDLDRLWAELKPGRRTLEIRDESALEPWGGIGVVWM